MIENNELTAANVSKKDLFCALERSIGQCSGAGCKINKRMYIHIIYIYTVGFFRVLGAGTWLASFSFFPFFFSLSFHRRIFQT